MWLICFEVAVAVLLSSEGVSTSEARKLRPRLQQLQQAQNSIGTTPMPLRRLSEHAKQLVKLISLPSPSEEVLWHCNEVARQNLQLHRSQVPCPPTSAYDAAASCKHNERYEDDNGTFCSELQVYWGMEGSCEGVVVVEGAVGAAASGLTFFEAVPRPS